jgi:hypothetical protein
MAKNPRADHFWNEKLQKRERFADFAYSLARIDWQFFTTHTYKNPMPRLSVQYDIFYRWLYQVSKICKVPYGRILMALRGENGERGGRHHFHSLLGGCRYVQHYDSSFANDASLEDHIRQCGRRLPYL